MAPPPPNVAVLLIAIGRRVQEEVEDQLGQLGMSYRHVSALGHLAAGDRPSYSELARRASITVQSMQATVDHLEEIGAVERALNAQQGRRAELTVTVAGRRLLSQARSRIQSAEGQVLDTVDPDVRTALETGLVQIFMTYGLRGRGVQWRGRGLPPMNTDDRPSGLS